MAKRQRKNRIEDSADLQMTPMIDIVFQLLIFFLLSAKFVALEGQLASFLPKDRGTEATPEVMQLAKVDLFLEWSKDENAVSCLTVQYKDPNSGNTLGQYEFQPIDAGQKVRFGDSEENVEYEYTTPDFQELETYLRYRHETFEDTRGLSKGLPVTVNFDDKVPVQMVVNILDICTRVGITDFTLAAKEQEIN